MSETKQKIISAVIEFIRNDASSDALTLSKVAAKAGIGKSTVYEYFANKEALLAESFLYMVDECENRVLAPLISTDFKGMYIEQSQRIYDAMRDGQMVVSIFVSQEQPLSWLDKADVKNRIKVLRLHLFERYEDIFTVGLREDHIKGVFQNPLLPHVLMAVMSGLITQHLNGDIAVSESELHELIYVSSLHLINA